MSEAEQGKVAFGPLPELASPPWCIQRRRPEQIQ